MTQKTINVLINENYSKRPKQNYNTNKTDVYYLDDIWSLDILDLKDYGSENEKRYENILVVIDKFRKYDSTVSLKNKNGQTLKDAFESILIPSKRKPGLIETDRGKEFFNIIFQNSLNNNNIIHYATNSLFSAVFAATFNRTIRDLPKRPVFQSRYGNWIDILTTMTKQYNNRTRSSTKLTPIENSLKKREICLLKFIRQKKENKTKN